MLRCEGAARPFTPSAREHDAAPPPRRLASLPRRRDPWRVRGARTNVDEDELPRSTSFMANNLTRTLLAASERNPTSYMSKAMSTQGRAAKTFAKEFNPEPSKKQYNKARGLGKTATVVTTQLTSIYNALKGRDGLATSKLGDAIHALDAKYKPPPGAIHPQEAAATFLTELALDPSQALDADAFIGASILRPEAITQARVRQRQKIAKEDAGRPLRDHAAEAVASPSF